MYRLVIVSNVLLSLFFNVLYIDNLLNYSDPTVVGGLLYAVLLTEGLLFLLELEELAPLRLVNDCGIYGGQFGDFLHSRSLTLDVRRILVSSRTSARQP